jgi:hypothetical protein
VTGLRVELLWWEGCPSTEKARDLLAKVLTDSGLDPSSIEMREIRTDAEVERERFVGSPTIRVGGVEVAPEEGEPLGLTCRVYRTGDGQTSPVPDPQDIHAAIEEATS